MASETGGLPGLEKEIQKKFLDFIFAPLTGAFMQKEKSCPPEKQCPPEKVCPPPETGIEISIQDKTTKNRFQGTDLNDMAEAMNKLIESYRKIWDTPKYNCKVYPKDVVSETKYICELIDDMDVVGAYGYHMERQGIFNMKVGVETILKGPENGLFQRKSPNGRSVSDVVAHEILETLGNPYVNRETFTPFLPVYFMTSPALNFSIIDIPQFIKQQPSLFKIVGSNGKIINGSEFTDTLQVLKIYIAASIRTEVVNPVQGNKVDVIVNNRPIEVADFITPNWFDMNSKGPYNFKKTLSRPFELDVGGYVDFFIRNIKTVSPTEQFFMFRLE